MEATTAAIYHPRVDLRGLLVLPTVTFIIYKDRYNEWRWTLRAKNGKKIADCGEGYRRRSQVRRMIEKIILGPHKIAT